MASLIGLETVGGLIPGLTEATKLALPYIEKLTLQGTLASSDIARSVLEGGIPRLAPRLSSNEILRQLRAAGLGMRRSVGLKAIKTIRAIADNTTRIHGLTGSAVPLKASIPFATSKQANTYYIRTMVRTYNPDLDTYETRAITLRSNRLMSNNDIADRLSSLLASSGNYATVEYAGHVVMTYTQRVPVAVE